MTIMQRNNSFAKANELMPPDFLGARRQQPSHPIADDEDDSTIKCICGFQHDDGNSVFCEKCSTWQHTECYYYIADAHQKVPTGAELESITHLCADCFPRPLDVQAAVDRQRVRVQEMSQDEKKAKRGQSGFSANAGAQSRGQNRKKAMRLPDQSMIHDPASMTEGSPADFESAIDRPSKSPRDFAQSSLTGRRPRLGHKSSNSTSASAAGQSTETINTFGRSSKRANSQALNSPLKADPQYQSHSHDHQPQQQSLGTSNGSNSSRGVRNGGKLGGPFSLDFLHLYDEDEDVSVTAVQTNLHNDINITQNLSKWTYDPDALREATRGFSHADVFHRMDRPLSEMVGSEPLKEYAEEQSVVIDGRHPRWIFLRTEQYTEAKTIIGELKGKIGHMNEYIRDPVNRWDYLRHPAPFVFFHPKLPIYIDTRHEGTFCRYLRRSCRPNLTMTTFLENGSEYHFCFTAKEAIPAGSELTIGWVPDEHIRKFGMIKDESMSPESITNGEEYIIDWISKVLPEFGGCACGDAEHCWLATRLAQSTKSTDQNVGSNANHHPGNLTAGTASGRDVMQRRPSHSHESLPRYSSANFSGNNTDRQTSSQLQPKLVDFPGVEISDREKRKIAALEKNFEQMDQERHQNSHSQQNQGPLGQHNQQHGPRKKKRSSGGPNQQGQVQGQGSVQKDHGSGGKTSEGHNIGETTDTPLIKVDTSLPGSLRPEQSPMSAKNSPRNSPKHDSSATKTRKTPRPQNAHSDTLRQKTTPDSTSSRKASNVRRSLSYSDMAVQTEPTTLSSLNDRQNQSYFYSPLISSGQSQQLTEGQNHTPDHSKRDARPRAYVSLTSRLLSRLRRERRRLTGNNGIGDMGIHANASSASLVRGSLVYSPPSEAKHAQIDDDQAPQDVPYPKPEIAHESTAPRPDVGSTTVPAFGNMDTHQEETKSIITQDLSASAASAAMPSMISVHASASFPTAKATRELKSQSASPMTMPAKLPSQFAPPPHDSKGNTFEDVCSSPGSTTRRLADHVSPRPETASTPLSSSVVSTDVPLENVATSGIPHDGSMTTANSDAPTKPSLMPPPTPSAVLGDQMSPAHEDKPGTTTTEIPPSAAPVLSSSAAIPRIPPVADLAFQPPAPAIPPVQAVPSPMKKKVSLSDYLRRKGSHPVDGQAKAQTSSVPEE